jgi:hypothetical protein
MNKGGLKKRVNENRKLTKPLNRDKRKMTKKEIEAGFEEKYGRPMNKKEKEKVYGKGAHSSVFSPLQLLQIWNNVSGR